MAQKQKSLWYYTGTFSRKLSLEDAAINTYQAFIFVGRYRYIDKDGKDELIDLSLLCCFGVIHAVFGFACDGGRG